MLFINVKILQRSQKEQVQEADWWDYTEVAIKKPTSIDYLY